MNKQTDLAAARIRGNFGGRGWNHRPRRHYPRVKPAFSVIESSIFCAGNQGYTRKTDPEKAPFSSETRRESASGGAGSNTNRTASFGGRVSFESDRYRLPGIGGGRLFTDAGRV